MATDISLEVADTDLYHPDPDQLVSWVEATLGREDRPGEICLYVVGDQEMAELNGQYRGKPESTNVLSFPAEIPANVPLAPLGDIVLCSPLIGQEARDQGKAVEAHWAHLVVHGTLHLLGYDHETPTDAEQMERREIEILADFGIANPYS